MKLFLNLTWGLILLSCSSPPRNFVDYEIFPILPPQDENIEASGLYKYDNHFYIINDEDDKIYELNKQDSVYQAKIVYTIDLPPEITSLKTHKLDMEGITYCNNKFYILDERDRLIYKLNLENKKIDVLQLTTQDYLSHNPKGFSVISNFAFEGIACDEKSQILYVANEKRPMMIYAVSLKTEKILDVITFPDESFFNLFIQDISDLYFYNSHLYFINRSKSRIDRLNLQTKEVEASINIAPFEHRDYKTSIGTPFIKMAEGLVIDDQYIYLVLDANGLTPKDQTRPLSSLVVIKKPPSF